MEILRHRRREPNPLLDSTQAAASYCQNTFRPYLGWRLNALESLGCYAAVAACALGVLGIVVERGARAQVIFGEQRPRVDE